VDTVRRRQTARDGTTTAAAVRTSSLVPGHCGRRAHTGVVLARWPVQRPAGHRAGRVGQLHRVGRHRRRSSAAAVGGGHRSAGPGHRRVRGPDPAARPDVRRTAHLRVQTARRLLLSVLVVRRRSFRPRQSSFCLRRRSVTVTLLLRIVFVARTRLVCRTTGASLVRSSVDKYDDERLNLPT